MCSVSPSAPLVACNWTNAPGFTNPTIWVKSNGSMVLGGNSNYSLVLAYGFNCTRFGCGNWSVPTEVTPGRTGEDPWIWQVCCLCHLISHTAPIHHTSSCRTRRETGMPCFTTVSAWQVCIQRWVTACYYVSANAVSPDLPAGRHAFSRDGITWSLTADLAYNGTVIFEDGSNVTFSKRERPHLLLDGKRAPIALFTGVMQFSEHVDDHSWTLAQGIRGSNSSSVQ